MFSQLQYDSPWRRTSPPCLNHQPRSAHQAGMPAQQEAIHACIMDSRPQPHLTHFFLPIEWQPINAASVWSTSFGEEKEKEKRQQVAIE